MSVISNEQHLEIPDDNGNYLAIDPADMSIEAVQARDRAFAVAAKIAALQIKLGISVTSNTETTPPDAQPTVSIIDI